MAYTSPKLEQLIASISVIRETYKKQNKKRNQLINILEAIQDFTEINLRDDTLSESQLQQICTGAFVLALETIAIEYKMLNPFSSTLYKLLSDALNIKTDNKLPPETKLIFLERFYNLIFSDERSENSFAEIWAEKNLESALVKKYAHKAMKFLLHTISGDVKALLKATPTEKNIDKATSDLHEDYESIKKKTKGSFFKSNAINGHRQFHAQLAEAICELVKEEGHHTEETLCRSQRIKMGALLYIMQSINNEYYLRSPTNSALFNLCRGIMNVEHLSDIKIDNKLIWITAFKHFILDNNALGRIEKYGDKFGKNNLLKEIDPKIALMHIELDQMITQLFNSSRLVNWPATKTLGELGALLMAAPGYGTGFVLGYWMGETNYTVHSKMMLSSNLTTGTAFLGMSGGHMGFLAADFIVQSTLTRFIAKVLEQIGMVVGKTTGGTIGIIFDLSYKGSVNLCNCLRYLVSELNDPVLMKDVNSEFIECLLKLPPEIFSNEKQNKIKKLSNDVVTDKDLEIRTEQQSLLTN